MRITLTLGGKYSNIRFDIPVPIADAIWEKIGEKCNLLTHEQQIERERERQAINIERTKEELKKEVEEDFTARLDKILAAEKRRRAYGLESG